MCYSAYNGDFRQERFAFEAFLPTDKKEREEVLKEMAAETRTIVMYEAPHRLVKTLKLLAERLGDRKVTVCRELTKGMRQHFNQHLKGAVAYYEANDPKGECVIVIAGEAGKKSVRKKERWEDMSIEDHMEYYISQGVDQRSNEKRLRKTAAFRSVKFIITWRSKNHKKHVLRVAWVKNERTA